MRAVIVGANEVTRQLLKRLGQSWQVCVIAPTEEELVGLKRERTIEGVIGDGSSRIILEQAGLAECDAVVANSDDDDRNLEICRIARGGGVLRLVAIAAHPDRLPDYADAEVPAFSPSRLAARQIDPHLEVGSVTSKAFAQGKVEASEFVVTPNSPVRGMSVAQINSEDRTVAAILRGGEVIIPNGNGDTVIERDDLVTVVGTANELPLMIQGFTEAHARFPLDHGKRVAVVLASHSDLGKTYAEAITITRYSRATSLLLVHPDQEGEEQISEAVKSLLGGASFAAEGIEVEYRASENPGKKLHELLSTESIGVMVVAAPSATGRFGYLRANRPLKEGAETDTPVLFARGRHSYERVVVAARRSASGEAAARAAIDIAELSGAELVALAVTEPSFVAGPHGPEESRSALQWVKEQAALQGIEVSGSVREGNPLRAFLDATEEGSLLVLGALTSPRPLGSRLTNRLAHRSKASVLVVPAWS